MKYLSLIFIIIYLSLNNYSLAQTGKGMHVKGNKLLDGNDEEFIFRGVNLPHAWFVDKTQSSINDIAELGANSARIVLGCGDLYKKTPINELEKIINLCEDNGLVCVLELHDFTGSDEPSDILDKSLNYWDEVKDLLNAHKDYIIINIANEWEGSWDKGILWADTYMTAVKKMRGNGIENAIMIDASGYGQETGPVIKYAKMVLDNDPDKNIIFSYHVYSVLGKDDESLYSGLNGLKETGVCWIIGEFGWWQNGGDVVYKTLTNYCNKNNIGWIAWSWAGNGGIDRVLDLASPITFSKKDLTGWGDYIFYSEFGIQKTSKLAYTYKTYKGEKHEIVDGVYGIDIPEQEPPRNTSLEVSIDAGVFTKYDWKVVINGDADNQAITTTTEKLSNGGIRANVDLSVENYPTLLVLNDKGYDLSSHSTINLIIRNNNANVVQIDLIFKAGTDYKWYEPNKPHPYIDVAGMMTQMITFNIESVGEDLTDIKQISFRIQPSSGKISNSIDFCHMGFDEDDNAYDDIISEMNRPKSADYFTWAYPDNTATGTPIQSIKVENGVVSFSYKIEGNIYGGCQTETRPGLGLGLDFSKYNVIKATLTNKGDSPVHCTIIIKTGNGWRWQESAGSKSIDGIENEEQIIPGGESVNVYYYLKHHFWKTQASNWQYTAELIGLDDVRAIEFKIYNGGDPAKGTFEISNFEILSKEE